MNFQKLADELGLEVDEYRELVELFMTTGAAEFEKLNTALAAGDTDTLVRSAHTIKGASGNLGLTDVYKTATVIEKNAGSGNLDGLAQHVKTMRVQFDAIAAFVGQ